MPSVAGEHVLPSLGLSHLVDHHDHALSRFVGDLRRRDQTPPVRQLHVDALFLQGRHRREGRNRSCQARGWGGRTRTRCRPGCSILTGRDSQRPQLAGLDLVLELAVARNTGRHLAAKDGSQRLTATGERHVVDGRRIDPHGLRHQTNQDVVGAAGRPTTPGDGARIRLEVFHQVVERLVLRVRRDHDDLVLGG